MSASISSGFTDSQGTSQGTSQGSSQGSSTGASQGTSQSGSYIPDYEPQLGFLDQFGNTAGQLGAQQYGWAQDQFQNNSDLTEQNINGYLQNSDMAGQAAQRDYANYNDTFNPAMGSLVDDATSYASPERINSEMGRSEAGVAQNFDSQRKDIENNLKSYGVNPSDPRYAGTMAANRTAQAAAEAGAGTTARLATEQTGRDLRSQVLQQADLLPGQTATEQNVSMQGNTGAQNAAMTNTSMGALTMGTAPNYVNSGIADVKFQPLGTDSSSQNNSSNNSSNTSSNTSQNSSQNTSHGQNASQSQSGTGGSSSPPKSSSLPPQQNPAGAASTRGGQNPSAQGNGTINAGHSSVPGAGIQDVPGGDGSASGTDEWGNPFSGYGDPSGNNGSAGQPDPFGSGYPGGANDNQSFPNPGDEGYPSGDSGYTDPNAAPNWDPGWGDQPSTAGPDETDWGDGNNIQTGIPMDQFDDQFTGGDFDAATGGAIPDGHNFAGGGYVPPSMSPSGGARTDDIPATVPQTGAKAQINAGEFIVPQDVTKWFGHKFFQDLIMKARKANQSAPAHPTMQNGVQHHADGGEVINQQTHPEWYAANGAPMAGTPAWDVGQQQVQQSNNARAQNIWHGTSWDTNDASQTAAAQQLPAQIRAYKAANPNATPAQLSAVTSYYQKTLAKKPAQNGQQPQTQPAARMNMSGPTQQGIPDGSTDNGDGTYHNDGMLVNSNGGPQTQPQGQPPQGPRMSTQSAPRPRPSQTLPTIANYKAGTAQGQFRPQQPSYYQPQKPFAGSPAAQPGPAWNPVHAPAPAAPTPQAPQPTPQPSAPSQAAPQTPARPAGMSALEAQYYDTGDTNWKFDAGAANQSGKMLFGSETVNGQVVSDGNTVGYNQPDPHAPVQQTPNGGSTVTPGMTLPGAGSAQQGQPSPGLTGSGGLNTSSGLGQVGAGISGGAAFGSGNSFVFKKGGAVPGKNKPKAKAKAKKPARGIPE